jgi:putative ABC transport system ATP-binding protein
MATGTETAAAPTGRARGASVLLDHVWRVYSSTGDAEAGVFDVSAEIEGGTFVTLTGPSGSGKTTLLNLVAALDRPDRGKVLVDGCDIGALGERAQASYRLSTVGTVFQDAPLVAELSVANNVALPGLLAGTGRGELNERVDELLARAGLEGKHNSFPAELSAGQRQRVDVARALVNRPALLVADEPTGNLDRATGRQVLALVAEARHLGCTVLLVTHDPEVAEIGDRQLRLLDGRLLGDTVEQ